MKWPADDRSGRDQQDVIKNKKHVNAGHPLCSTNRRNRIKRRFPLAPRHDVPVIRDRSALPPTSEKLQYIAPEEIDLAIQKVVEEAIAIQPKLLCHLSPGYSGLQGLRGYERELSGAIELSVSQQVIIKDGDF